MRRVIRDDSSETSSLDRLASVDLNLLVPLLALLEERSVTRAATRVGLSQPALSHALSRMRRLLDDDLLVRRGASMTLTPRAAELVVPLRESLGRAARVIRFPGFDPTSDERVITVAMTSSTAQVIGGPLGRLVSQRAPHATLRIRTFTVPDDSIFTEDSVDVVLLSGAFSSPHPRERLYDDRWVVIAARDAAPQDATALDLLGVLPHVLFEGPHGRLLPYVVLQEHRVPCDVRLVVPDNVLIPELVAEIGGVGLHRHQAMNRLERDLPLRVDEFPFAVPGLGLDMVWNPRLTDDGFVGWLRGILHEAAAEVTS